MGRSSQMVRDGMSLTGKALFVLTVSVLLAGCGVRGTLQAPKADTGSSSSSSPNNAPPEKSTTATASSGQGREENAAPKPHQGFILDGLLR